MAGNFYWGGVCYLLEAHDTLGPSPRTTTTIQSLMDSRCVRAIQSFVNTLIIGWVNYGRYDWVCEEKSIVRILFTKMSSSSHSL